MLDLSDGQAAIEAFFMPDLGTFRRGATVLAPDVVCGLTAVSGQEATPELITQRGAFRLSLPVTFTLALKAGDLFVLRDRVYTVVWTPALDSIALERVVGLAEGR